jgi:multiple sugar transport system permease protein
MFRSLRKYANSPRHAGYFFVLPSMVIITVFLLGPLLVSFLLSMMKFDVMWKKVDFVGFANFARLFKDARFLNALEHTLVYSLFVVTGQVLLGLLLALGLHRQGKANVAFRGVFFLPVICSMTIISIIWLFLLNPDIGTISYYLTRVGLRPVDFLKSPDFALPSIIVVGIWKDFAFPMIIFIAAINNVPRSYYEACDIDGGGAVKKFFHITLPQIIPSIGFVAITQVIKSFQVFDQVFVMTQGGPMRKTETVVQYIYMQGFEKLDMGYASATAEVLFIIILGVSMLMFSRFQKGEASLGA